MADVEDVDINEKTVKEVKVTGKTRHNPLADENNTYGLSKPVKERKKAKVIEPNLEMMHRLFYGPSTSSATNAESN